MGVSKARRKKKWADQGVKGQEKLSDLFLTGWTSASRGDRAPRRESGRKKGNTEFLKEEGNATKKKKG